MGAKYYTAEKNVQVVVALLKSYGIRKIIASPGTTNLTFVASLQYDPFFEVYSAPEERSAAYMAVGMAEESGEPVVITCTGATASRNYLPGLTEAFYRKLPVLAITATQPYSSVGQLVPQVIDRTSLPKDTSVYSVHIPVVKDNADLNYSIIKTNEAFHYLKKNGGGPIHINLETSYSQDFSVRELPRIKCIDYYRIYDSLPIIQHKRVGILVGSHSAMSEELTTSINLFCKKYGAVVYCDHTSNYKGEYRFQYPLVLSQDDWVSGVSKVDLLIHIGGVSGAYTQPQASQIWRVNEDGVIRSVYGIPKAVFEMREIDFFNHYSNNDVTANLTSYLSECRTLYKELYQEIPVDLPFSNIWIAKQMSGMVPEYAVMHFGILNSLRSWNFFELPSSVNSYSNVGGFGIDGPISTLIGGALSCPERMHILVVGDLAFFYDMNSLGNRHLPSNIRILLINNGRGTEFTNYNHPAYNFGDDANKYMAAAGHYGRQSSSLVKHYSEDLGFDYLSAKDKNEFTKVAQLFVAENDNENPVLLEVFTNSDDENKALHAMRSIRADASTRLQNSIRKAVGRNAIEVVKKIINR